MEGEKELNTDNSRKWSATGAEIRKKLPFIDDEDVLERIEDDLALEFALLLTRPRNWWGTGIKPEVLITIAHEEEIPVVWVPNKDILKELAEASDATERKDILVNKKDEIIRDCRLVLAECTEPILFESVTLAEKALNAFSEGHHETAMAQAVSLAEPLAKRTSDLRNRIDPTLDDLVKIRKNKSKGYDLAKDEYIKLINNMSEYIVDRLALIAPICEFYTDYFVERGDPIPENLSRHVVAHNPVLEHFSLSNSIISIMLICSLLREHQFWADDSRGDD